MNYKDNNVVIPGLTGNLLSIWKVLPLAAVVILLAACGDDGSDKTAGGTEEDAGIIAIENKTVSGVSQKGPFVNGSSVTVYGLDGETLAQTGNIYEGKIRSDMGDFSVKVVKLASQYALLKANGFYRNEVTGEKSNSQMTLYALTDLSDRDEVNVNLLTHLAYERSLYLATNSMSVASAKAQAEAEVFKSFEIEGDFASAEDLNIFGENDQSAALLAISVMMQGDLKEADFSERLDNYARDIETDGVWDDKNTATFIADWASEKSLSGGLASVRANVEKWGQLFGVPPFEKYVNNFWWQNYGLGTCDAKQEGEILQASNPLSVNNGVYFICNNGGWRVATDLERDTYKWKAGKDADVKFGDVVKTNCYVFEDKAWRSGNDSDCSLDLRGCTALRQDTVGLGADKVWHICDTKQWRTATDIEKDTAAWGAGAFDGEVHAGQVNETVYYIYETSGNAWRKATTLEKDTYKKECLTDGSIVDGNVISSNKYVCDADTFRSINSLEENVGLGCVSYNRNEYFMPANFYSYYKCGRNGWFVATDKLNLGSVVDSRDGQEYETVGIGSQIWMRENLNYKTECRMTYGDGKIIYPQECAICPNKELSLCDKYGKLYVFWRVPNDICPNGWHEPSREEWKKMISFLGKYNEECESTEVWCDAAELNFGVVEAYFSDNIFAGEFYVSSESEDGEAAEEFYSYSGLGSTGRFATSMGYVVISTTPWDTSSDKIRISFDVFVDYESKSVRCIKDEE